MEPTQTTSAVVSTEDRLKTLEAKLDAVYISVEKGRKYFLALVWITVITFLLPLLGIIFAGPTLLAPYTNALSGADAQN